MSHTKLDIEKANTTVGLFVSCMVDVLYPQVGVATVNLLADQGVDVVFPENQTCCGQPTFNAGQQDESYILAANFLDIFAPMLERKEISAIVVPSGSCAAMIKHSYSILAEKKQSTELAKKCAIVSKNTYELSEYLIDVLGVNPPQRDAPLEQLTYHPCCHLLRDLHVDRQPRQLLAAITDNKLLPLPEAETCCGFGGLFSLWNEELSVEMGLRKVKNLKACGAELVAVNDVGCMTHINGILIKQGSSCRAVHIAELLIKNETK